MAKIVICNGAHYLMSEANFEMMMRHYARGDQIHLPDYGTHILTFDFSNISRNAAGEYINESKEVL